MGVAEFCFSTKCWLKVWLEEMMSKTPIEIDKMGKRERDLEIMRTAITAELDAISLYEQLAAQTDDVNMKKVLSDVAREEKTHFGEFQELLLRMDKEQVRELNKAKEEVRELTEK
jgi:rubrerythrin